MERVILHCDCNSFFASVETVLNPEYNNVPMAVCGSVEDRHGIVLAKNELAKKYNIKTAETVFSAKKKCPKLVIAKPHHLEYIKFSKKVNEIYARYTDLIEPFGIDESWLDVTASKKFFGTGEEIAESIRLAVKKELGITISIGVSFNKVFAKLGSDYKKPDAVTVINKDNFKDIIYPLPASDLLFVGSKTSSALEKMGIRTIGELSQVDIEILKAKFGKMGEMLYRYSRGLDDSPVVVEREEAKSIGNGFTFRHDLVSKEECRIGIDFLSDAIGSKLRQRGLKCSTVQLSVKDEYLRVVQRQKTLSQPTDISKEIADVAYSILLSEWTMGRPVRMITVTACNLVSSDVYAQQIDIFSDKDENNREKIKKKEETVDIIRRKFGKSSITHGSIINTDIGDFDS